MKKHKIALIGFGTVGQGLMEILRDKKDYLRDRYGLDYRTVAIADAKLGSIHNPDGICPHGILDVLEKSGEIKSYPEGKKGLNAVETIKTCDADTVFEATYTNIETAEPATTHLKEAFKSGKNVVTSNKGPLALNYKELRKLAGKNDAAFKFEGTVLSGTPALNLASNELAGCEIEAIKGIMNGTTNYILSRMEEGGKYEEVLSKAQELGYAEADPTADVEGFDALAKVVILGNVLMDAGLTPDDVERTGITGITLDDVKSAAEQNERWKLIGSIEKDADGVDARVEPVKLPVSKPLAGVMGPTNALTYTTDLMGDITISGPGAGKTETGYSLLTDLIEIHRKSR